MPTTSTRYRGLKWASAATATTLLLLLASMPTTVSADVVELDRARPDSGHDAGPSCPPEMVYIPAANVRLGAAASGPQSLSNPPNPPHFARLRAFCIDRFEVSVATYATCPWCVRSGRVDAGLCQDGPDQLPVRCITQLEAGQYCASHGRRLASSDEWEYAARGTDQRMYPWGNALPSTAFALPREVGADPHDVSPFGVLGMQGNVAEWVSDRAQNSGGRPCGVVRGASLLTRVDAQWPASVVFAKCDLPTPLVGVRCAMDAP